jgi:hypothetical protein
MVAGYCGSWQEADGQVMNFVECMHGILVARKMRIISQLVPCELVKRRMKGMRTGAMTANPIHNQHFTFTACLPRTCPLSSRC